MKKYASFNVPQNAFLKLLSPLTLQFSSVILRKLTNLEQIKQYYVNKLVNWNQQTFNFKLSLLLIRYNFMISGEDTKGNNFLIYINTRFYTRNKYNYHLKYLTNARNCNYFLNYYELFSKSKGTPQTAGMEKF